MLPSALLYVLGFTKTKGHRFNNIFTIRCDYFRCVVWERLSRVNLAALGGVRYDVLVSSMVSALPAWKHAVETCKKVVAVVGAGEGCESIPMRCRCVEAGWLWDVGFLGASCCSKPHLMCLRASCFLCSAAGFEGCSMVPSIYPLETLHNSLSLKQVNEFLSAVCESAGDQHTRTTRGKKTNQ